MKNYIPILILLFLIISLAGFAMYSIYYDDVPGDNKEEMPNDVANAFFLYLGQDNYLEAKNLWTSDSIDKIKISHDSFELFCKELWMGFETVKLSRTYKSKGRYYVIRFIGYEDDDEVANRWLTFVIEDGSWKLVW